MEAEHLSLRDAQGSVMSNLQLCIMQGRKDWISLEAPWYFLPACILIETLMCCLT